MKVCLGKTSTTNSKYRVCKLLLAAFNSHTHSNFLLLQIPGFNKKGELLDSLCEYSVPMKRAVWFIKVFSCNSTITMVTACCIVDGSIYGQFDGDKDQKKT